MARARIPDAEGRAALSAALGVTGGEGAGADAAGASGPSRAELATAVRWTLQLLAERHPGHTVEVRVPPFAAVQAIEGPRHTRGTPPNVIETDAATWLALATGALAWSDALDAARATASGSRADLAAVLPLLAP